MSDFLFLKVEFRNHRHSLRYFSLNCTYVIRSFKYNIHNKNICNVKKKESLNSELSRGEFFKLLLQISLVYCNGNLMILMSLKLVCFGVS